MDLYEIELPTRIANILKDGGLETVEEVRALTDAELRRIPNLGSRALREIRDIVGPKAAELVDLKQVSSARLIAELSRRLKECDSAT